jgi:hypothetical protein
MNKNKFSQYHKSDAKPSIFLPEKPAAVRGSFAAWPSLALRGLKGGVVVFEEVVMLRPP